MDAILFLYLYDEQSAEGGEGWMLFYSYIYVRVYDEQSVEGGEGSEMLKSFLLK